MELNKEDVDEWVKWKSRPIQFPYYYNMKAQESFHYPTFWIFLENLKSKKGILAKYNFLKHRKVPKKVPFK